MEPSFTVQIRPRWKWIGSYRLPDFHTDKSGVAPGHAGAALPLDDIGPPNEWSPRCAFDLPCHVSIDAGGRSADEIAGADRFFAADFRVAWKPTGNATDIGPQVYGRITFKS